MKVKHYFLTLLCILFGLGGQILADEATESEICMCCGARLPLPPPFDCPCSTCGYHVNCDEPVDYVDYRPWENSHDPGLYCFPGSRWRYLCPTKPTGAELYKPWAETAHTKRRYPSERTPEDWHTIMMLMRVMAPMPACAYRKITAFMMGQPYGTPHSTVIKVMKSSDNPEGTCESHEESKASSSNDLSVLDKEKTNPKHKEDSSKVDLSFLDEKKSKTEEKGGTSADLSFMHEEKNKSEEQEGASAVNLSFLNESKNAASELPTIKPSIAEAISADIHTVYGGYLYLDYISRRERNNALNGPSDFRTRYQPLFYASYLDSLLVAAAIEFNVVNTQIEVDFHFAKVMYFFNDWITLEFGKLVLPFGVYAMWWEPLSEFVFDPWIRDEQYPIAPDGDVGIEVQGAIPLCGLIAPYFDCAFFTYDFWVGNGPSETDNSNDYDIDFDTNGDDNNGNKAFGGRVAFWPNPLAVIGFSFMRARWNTTNATGAFPKDHLYYNGICVDWNWNVGDYINFKGEYLWTEYDYTPTSTITRQGFWAEGAIFLTLLGCINRKLYCSWPCFWDSLQVGVRGGGVWSTRPSEDRKRLGFIANYYLTESAKCQLEYDINGGAEGYRENVFGIRLYWMW